jgi:hypothetical protein
MPSILTQLSVFACRDHFAGAVDGLPLAEETADAHGTQRAPLSQVRSQPGFRAKIIECFPCGSPYHSVRESTEQARVV